MPRRARKSQPKGGVARVMTPYCPECGSIKVAPIAKGYRCSEPDCGCEGSHKKFRNHVGFVKPVNQKWRDPVALTPGGYEDNQ